MEEESLMTEKDDLKDWVFSAIQAHGGEATLVEVAKHIWENHEEELRASGDLFYTWQYDMRWATQYLRDTGKLRPANVCQRGSRELARAA